MKLLLKIIKVLLGEKYRVEYTGIDKDAYYDLRTALDNGVSPEEFVRNREVPPVSYIGDDPNDIDQVIFIAGISGGQDYKHAMPRMLSLQRCTNTGAIHYCNYYQAGEVPAPLIQAGRRVGNSTRQIDNYIQQLFTYGSVTIRDHYFSNNSNRLLFHRVLDRLKLEHNLPELIKSGDISINKGDCVIKLKNK